MSVQELERNKKYKIVVVVGYNGDKMLRHCETFYGKKSEAEIRESEIKAEVKNQSYVKKRKITVQELMKEFLSYNKDKWSIKTYKANLNWIKNINEKIGFINLQDLSVKVLEDFYSHLKNDTTYSEQTIRHHYNLINCALNKAITWGYITQNVNERIERPKVRKKEVECYSVEEVEKLLDVLKNEPLKYQAIIYLALDSGIRRGELTRLEVERCRL